MKKISFFDSDNFDFHITAVSCRASFTGKYQPFGIRSKCELIYKIDGSSEQYFDGVTLDVVPDSVWFIPKKSRNSQLIKEDGRIIHIEFEMLTINGGADLPPEIICFDAGNPYKKLFLSAEEVWRQKKAGYYQKTHSIVSEILAGIASDREKQYIQSGKYALIAPALKHIHENYRDEISVASLAKLCGISDEYLRILFKSCTGQTPLSYINNLRLENAREMLVSGFSSVSEVAAANGFENIGYFSRLFKKHYSVPPSKAGQIEILIPSEFRNGGNEKG